MMIIIGIIIRLFCSLSSVFLFFPLFYSCLCYVNDNIYYYAFCTLYRERRALYGSVHVCLSVCLSVTVFLLGKPHDPGPLLERISATTGTEVTVGTLLLKNGNRPLLEYNVATMGTDVIVGSQCPLITWQRALIQLLSVIPFE
jgi:hypothetical protein